MIAISDSDKTLIVVATISAAGGVLVGVLNFMATRKNRSIAKVASDKAEFIAETLDTGNEQGIGATIHSIADDVSLVQTQTKINTQEILSVHQQLNDNVETMHESVLTIGKQLETHHEDIKDLSKKIDTHIQEGAPTTAYVKRKMQEESND